jgi:hypothetical protein
MEITTNSGDQVLTLSDFVLLLTEKERIVVLTGAGIS